jgi:hypothetical protein
MRRLPELSDLEELHLHRANITDDGFVSLSRLNRLRILDLGWRSWRGRSRDSR